MTCRSLLWIAAAAVSAGAVASTPSITAAAEADEAWTITIDAPATDVIASKHLTIEGTVTNQGAGPTPPEDVIVTVTPQGLPPQCGTESGPATLAGDRYTIDLDLDCNGPHQIQAVAQGPQGSSSGEPLTIGVAESPPKPAPFTLEVTSEGGLKATWDPTTDPDADGTILVVNFREDPYPRGVTEAILPPADRNASVAIRNVRWGAGGPGTTVSSPTSGWRMLGEDPVEPPPPPPPPKPDPEPEPDPEPPATPQPTPGGPNTADPTPNPVDPGTTTPTSPAPSTDTPPTTPSTTSPADDSEVLSTVAKTAFVSGTDPDRRPRPHTDEQAISTAAPLGGLVHTSEKRTPGLVAPLALILFILTIAAHIARHHHRPTP